MINLIQSIDPEKYFYNHIKNSLSKKEELNKPIILPKREWKYYKKIHSTIPKYYKDLKQIWKKAKKKIAFAYAIEHKLLSQKSFFYKQQDSLDKSFEELQDQLEEEALLMIEEGLLLGNGYFEDTFKIPGLSQEELNIIKEQALNEFHESSTQLFTDTVLDKLENSNINSLENTSNILNTFDHLLLGYAGIAAALSYSIFANSIANLNKELIEAAGKEVIEEGLERPYAVQWILGETSNHSDDCIRLSQGNFTVSGYGVWDAEELSSQGLYPRSPLLDCGGNCLCHLSPVEVDQNTFLENVLFNNFLQSDEYSLASTLTQSSLLALLASQTNIGPNILESLGLNLSSLNNSPWESLFGNFSKQATEKTPLFFDFFTEQTSTWKISLQINTLGTKNQQRVRKADINIYGPDANSFDNPLPISVRKTLSHIMDSIAARTFLYQTPEYISNLLSEEEMDKLIKLVESEYNVTLRKLESDFQNTLRSFISPNFTNEEKEIIQYFQRENISLFKFIQNEEIQPLIIDLLRKMGLGRNLISFQQLVSPSDYLAEYLTLWMRSPSTARIINSRLLLGLQQILPEQFGKTISHKEKLSLPNQISIDQRLDIPEFKSAVVIPYIGGFSSIISSETVEVKTTKLKKESALRQLRRTIEETNTLRRPEYFENMHFIFISKLQMKRLTNRNKDIIALANGSDDVYINIDQWKLLSRQKNIELLAEVAFHNIWKNRIRKNKIKDIYIEYIKKIFIALESKFIQFGLPIKDLQILNNAIFSDIIIFRKNWNDLYNILKNIPDLPIMKIQSLQSPKEFFRIFFVNYILHPETALQYFGDELYTELLESLEI